MSEEERTSPGPAAAHRTLKACVTCRHFHVETEGEEVAGLHDTYYLDESCKVFGWKQREYPIMAPVKKDGEGRVVISTEPFDCPAWEPLE